MQISKRVGILQAIGCSPWSVLQTYLTVDRLRSRATPRCSVGGAKRGPPHEKHHDPAKLRPLVGFATVEVGVHGTTYFSGLYNPLVSGQLAWDLGYGWGFSYLHRAYIYKSPVAWSDTSLNQRFARSYTRQGLEQGREPWDQGPFVDVLTAKGELLLPRRGKLYQARTRLRAHKDFTQREYEAAVLRAEARAWKILG